MFKKTGGTCSYTCPLTLHRSGCYYSVSPVFAFESPHFFFISFVFRVTFTVILKRCRQRVIQCQTRSFTYDKLKCDSQLTNWYLADDMA